MAATVTIRTTGKMVLHYVDADGEEHLMPVPTDKGVRLATLALLRSAGRHAEIVREWVSEDGQRRWRMGVEESEIF